MSWLNYNILVINNHNNRLLTIIITMIGKIRKGSQFYIQCLFLQESISFAYIGFHFRLSSSKQSKVYLPEPPFPHAEVSL